MEDKYRKSPAEEYVVERLRKLEKELKEKQGYIDLLNALIKETREKNEELAGIVKDIASRVDRVDGKDENDYGYCLYLFRFIAKDKPVIDEIEKYIPEHDGKNEKAEGVFEVK